MICQGSFPEGYFRILGFSTPFCRDRDQFGEVILVFVREDIPSKTLSLEAARIKSLYIELNFRKKKWLLNCSYNPNRNNISNHLNTLRKSLDLYTSEYENIVPMGDFNAEINEFCMPSLCESYGLKSLIKEPTCYKNLVLTVHTF